VERFCVYVTIVGSIKILKEIFKDFNLNLFLILIEIGTNIKYILVNYFNTLKRRIFFPALKTV
jgi:hypothetical protein